MQVYLNFWPAEYYSLLKFIEKPTHFLEELKIVIKLILVILTIY